LSELKQKLTSLRVDPDAPRRRRRSRWPMVAVLVVLALVAAWAVLRRGSTTVVQTARAALLAPQEAAAGTPILTASGYLVPRRKAIVSSKIQGRLSELRVEEGSRVEEGAVLARLESNDYTAQVARASAAVTRAHASIARAEADLAEYRRQLRKATELADQGVVSVDQKEAAESRVNVAQAALSQANGDLGLAESERRVTEAELENTFIRAPFTGVVVRKMAEVGESVAPIPPGVNISTASGAIVALADLDTLEAELDVAEASVSKLGTDQAALVTVEAFPDRRYRGVLRQVIPSADRTRATVLVRVTLLDKDRDLKPEMSARADFLEGAGAPPEATTSVPAVTVPPEAVVTRDGTTQVFTVADGRVKAVAVTAGPARRGQTVIPSGLRGGETVVLAPPADLKDGDAVQAR
jgi:RND family efflux transporter MFP subunit